MRRLTAGILCGMIACLLYPAGALAVMEDYPSVRLQGLDKSVGRTVTFEATVGSTIQYGSLFIKIHACRKASPIEKPESAAFLQIWEVPPGADKSEWVFSGWMFASSPALSAMDHPVYDVWVLDCLGRDAPNEEAAAAESQEEADQTNLESVTPETGLSDENIPVDSEAEETPPAEPSSPYAPAPAPAPGQGIEPQDRPAPTIAPSLPTPRAEDDPGFTAYDLMR